MSRKRCVLIGKNGQLGFELEALFQKEYELFSFDHSSLDITNLDRLEEVLYQIKPDLIVNASAYTKVDLAEDEKEKAFLVNAYAPLVMAKVAKKLKALFVHYSTDYVFDGTSQKPYLEGDKTNPLSVYGESKRAGEELIQKENPLHLIFRTSWVYSYRGKNFLLTMLNLSKKLKEVSVVSDQIGAPTFSLDLAEISYKALKKDIVSGIYHLSNQGSTSWNGFAETIFSMMDLETQVIPISTKDYPTPAKRPLYSLLDNKKFESHFNMQMPFWKDSLKRCLHQLDLVS